MATLPILFLLAAYPTSASPDFCAPLDRLQRRVDSCERNPEFLSAAGLCLDKLDREVASSRKTLMTDFLAHEGASREAQNSQFQNHDGNLGETSASLRGILSDARRARGELLDYLGSLLYPGNPSPTLVRRYNLTGYLAAFPCYHDEREALLSRISALDRRIADLQRAESANLAALARSRGKLGGLEGYARAPASGEPVPRESGGSDAHQSGVVRPASGSTITGQTHETKLP